MTRDAFCCSLCGGVVLCRCDESDVDNREENDPHDLLGAVASTRGMVESHAKLIRELGEDAVKIHNHWDSEIEKIFVRLRSLEAMTAALQSAINTRLQQPFKERDD